MVSEYEMKRRQLVNELELAIIQAIPADVMTIPEILLALKNVEGNMLNMLLKSEWREEDEIGGDDERE